MRASLAVPFPPQGTNSTRSRHLAGYWLPVCLVLLTAPGANLAASNSPALSSVTCTSTSVVGPGTDSCLVTLTSPTKGSITVALSSSSSGSLSVPSAVSIPANASSATFTATASKVTKNTSVTLKATYNRQTVSTSVAVLAQVATLNVNATTIPFGTVLAGTVATQTLVLSSVGTVGVTVSGASTIGSGFSINGIAFPITLAPGQSANLNVTFSPLSSVAYSGTLTLNSNSSTGSALAIGLTGSGGTAEVSLTWYAPASSADPVAGYFVYRALSGGSFSKLTSSATTATNLLDTMVVSGSSYTYYVTSVDASGVESSASNTTTVSIP